MNWTRLLGIFIMFLAAAVFVTADPLGPSNFTLGSSTRFLTGSAANVSAIAGNVTQIDFTGIAITQTWQGYFGNVSGQVVLGNSAGNVLYNWTLASPSGEIYATRNPTTPTWTSIRCANNTELTSEDTALGTGPTDADRVSNTFFNTTAFSVFYVGNVAINQTLNDCYATHLFNNTGAQSTYYPEILLSDNSRFIYTAVIENSQIGFNGANHDFQMIVGENGHNGDAASTPYYFYLEIQ